MLHDTIRAVHQWAVIDTLEEAAFVFAEPCDASEIQWQDGEILEAKLELGCPPLCRLSLITSVRFSREIAGNMLGYQLDETMDSEDLAEDALAEALNIVAGVVVDHLPQNGNNANIGLPRIEKISSSVALGHAQKAGAITLIVNSNSWIVALTEIDL